MTIDEAFPIGREISERTMDSEDSIEGLSAFKEKRAPKWQGK
jgi:enoyl-CoA hydratase/carnithine racemase